jgi:hypothetical protein
MQQRAAPTATLSTTHNHNHKHPPMPSPPPSPVPPLRRSSASAFRVERSLSNWQQRAATTHHQHQHQPQQPTSTDPPPTTTTTTTIVIDAAITLEHTTHCPTRQVCTRRRVLGARPRPSRGSQAREWCIAARPLPLRRRRVQVLKGAHAELHAPAHAVARTAVGKAHVASDRKETGIGDCKWCRWRRESASRPESRADQCAAASAVRDSRRRGSRALLALRCANSPAAVRVGVDRWGHGVAGIGEKGRSAANVCRRRGCCRHGCKAAANGLRSRQACTPTPAEEVVALRPMRESTLLHCRMSASSLEAAQERLLAKEPLIR